jgi:hypothetical protein
VKLVRLRKAKNHMLSLICGLKTENKCSNVIGHVPHTEGKLCMGEIEKGKETKNLNVVDMLTV